MNFITLRGELRPRKTMQHAQGHTAGKWQCRDTNSGAESQVCVHPTSFTALLQLPEPLTSQELPHMWLTSHISESRVKSKHKNKETLILTFLFLEKKEENNLSEDGREPTHSSDN